MGIEFAFGQKGTWFFESPTAWKWNNIPAAMANLLQGGHVSRTYCVAFGENGSYMMAYEQKVGTQTICTAGLPENLHSWLLEVDSKGYLVRDVKNLMVTLGPNNSFFATDKKSTYWRNLPAPLDKEIIALRNSKNEMTTGFKCVQLGINDNYVMVKEGNGGAWQLSSYPGLNRFLDGVRTANENRGGMFQCIRYLWLDAFDATSAHYMILNSINEAFGDVPTDALANANEVIGTLQSTPSAPTVAAQPRTSHTEVLKSVINGTAQVVLAATTGDFSMLASG